ncbi:hypothetical protein AB0G02_24155 [Actinosynnema sp. NPDC023658]|uniref:hypothetical protein n=1 Tax=Actinosynnema sp. NPDC023658 TaxID=3155465 RepID=UPI0033F88852
MTEVTRLAAVRQAHEAAIAAREHARGALKKAGIQARAFLENQSGTLQEQADRAGVSPPVLSRLKPAKNGDWKAMDPSTYRAIDGLTNGQFRLEELRNAYDAAAKQANQGELDLRLVESEVDATPGPLSATTPDTHLVVDDVLVEQRRRSVVLDVRVRNSGHRIVNITRVAVRVIERRAFLASSPSTGDYDLKVDGDYSEAYVAHHVKPDDVDRFTVTLGFATTELGHEFTADVLVLFNRDNAAVSKSITFDSCFE